MVDGRGPRRFASRAAVPPHPPLIAVAFGVALFISSEPCASGLIGCVQAVRPSSSSSKTCTRPGRGKIIRWDQSGCTGRPFAEGSRDPQVVNDLASEIPQELGGRERVAS